MRNLADDNIFSRLRVKKAFMADQGILHRGGTLSLGEITSNDENVTHS